MLIALASAKGSPGVTTTTTVLGTVWPHDVLVADCDPVGGDVAVLHRDASGAPLDAERGLLSLAVAARRGLNEAEIGQHVQAVEGGLDVLTGVSNPDQVTAIGPVWPAVAAGLRDSAGVDVLADCGRVTPGTPVLPVLTAADAVILCVRPAVEAYAHLRERLRWLAGPLRLGELGGVPVGVVVIGPAKDTSAARDLHRLLQHDGISAPVIAQLAEDRKAADTLAGRRTGRLVGSLLVRSARDLASAALTLARNRPVADVSMS
jgi:MinD-like ATPase involved in chromosome partitioning or flagellar assembly